MKEGKRYRVIRSSGFMDIDLNDAIDAATASASEGDYGHRGIRDQFKRVAYEEAFEVDVLDGTCECHKPEQSGVPCIDMCRVR